MATEQQQGERLTFFALDPFVEEWGIDPKETKASGKDYIQWGTDNIYPNHLVELYQNCPTLHSIVAGSTDFVGGDSVVMNSAAWPSRYMDARRTTPQALVRALGRDAFLFGGFAIEVIRRKDGKGVAELRCAPWQYLRCNKAGDVFFYSEGWAERGSRYNQPLKVPVYIKDGTADRSIFAVKLDALGVYPMAPCQPALKECDTEMAIADFHLNAINNGFAASYIINFNNGQPPAQMKEEVEREMNAKFAGHKNAGRIMCSFNNSKANEATFTKVDVHDFADRYTALAKHCRQAIFTSYRAIPAIFGLMNETTGFSEQEFGEAFRLYNRTRIQPVQDAIVDAFDTILGVEGSAIITPFSLDGGQAVVQ